MDRTPVTNREFRTFVEATGYVNLRGNRARSEGLSGRTAAHAGGGLSGLQPAQSSRRPSQFRELVEF